MIRLYTDASLKGDVGSWAFVLIVPDADPIEDSGRFRKPMGCTAEAEAKAIGNALHKLTRSGYAPAGTAVTLCCDNRAVVDRIEGRLTNRHKSPAAIAVAFVAQLAAAHGIRLRAIWIKGHRPDKADEHAPFNNRADALCRAARTGRASPPKPPAKAPRVNKAQRALIVARALEGRA